MLPHRKLGINLQIRLNCFNCQLDRKRVISVITSLCCANHFSGDIRAPDLWWSSPSESRWLSDNYCSDWLRFSTSKTISLTLLSALDDLLRTQGGECEMKTMVPMLITTCLSHQHALTHKAVIQQMSRIIQCRMLNCFTLNNWRFPAV